MELSIIVAANEISLQLSSANNIRPFPIIMIDHPELTGVERMYREYAGVENPRSWSSSWLIQPMAPDKLSGDKWFCGAITNKVIPDASGVEPYVAITVERHDIGPSADCKVEVWLPAPTFETVWRLCEQSAISPGRYMAITVADYDREYRQKNKNLKEHTTVNFEGDGEFRVTARKKSIHEQKETASNDQK
jgi:hypothetical protein